MVYCASKLEKIVNHEPKARDSPSPETQGQSDGSGEKAGRKFSSTGERAPGYRLSRKLLPLLPWLPLLPLVTPPTHCYPYSALLPLVTPCYPCYPLLTLVNPVTIC